MVLRSFAAAIMLAVLAVFSPAEVLAGGNIKPGTTIFDTEVDANECYWDSAGSLTSSSLDSVSVHCLANRIVIESLTAGMSIAARVVGNRNDVRVFTSTKGSGWKRVDSDLTVFPAATGEYIKIMYKTRQPMLKGFIVDGQSTGDYRMSGFTE